MLQISHSRNGAGIEHVWSVQMLAAIVDVCSDEQANTPDYKDGFDELWHTGHHRLTRDSRVETPDEVVEFKAGDVISAWR